MRSKEDEIREIQAKANALQAEVHQLQEQQTQHQAVKRHLQAILSAYRRARIQIDGVRQGAAELPEGLEHEDQIIGRSADNFMQSHQVHMRKSAACMME